MSHEHEHRGDGRHGGIAFAEAAVPGRVMASAGTAHRPAPAAGRPAAALLDEFGWARSWSSFLAAIGDERDRQGAREAIRRVRDAAALSERIPSEGGFLVPQTLQDQILGLMSSAIVRPRATVVPVRGLRTGMPFLENYDQSTAGQALGGFTFSYVAESAEFTASNPEFGAVWLDLAKVGAYAYPVPNEFLADATPFTEVFLPQLIARGLAFFEDSQFITDGNGVGQPQSLLNSPAALAVDRATSDSVVLADLVAMLKGCHPESTKNAVWLVSKSAHDQIMDLYYAANGQVWNGSSLITADMPVSPPSWYVAAGASGVPEILGMPCYVNDFQPGVGDKGDAMLVDLSLYLVAGKGAMEVEVASNGAGFASDTSAIRVVHRTDGRFWPQSTYTTRTGQSVSPLVVLN